MYFCSDMIANFKIVKCKQLVTNLTILHLTIISRNFLDFIISAQIIKAQSSNRFALIHWILLRLPRSDIKYIGHIFAHRTNMNLCGPLNIPRSQYTVLRVAAKE